MYKSSIVVERIDYLMLEQGGGDKVFPQDEFMKMIGMSLEKPIEQVWRIRFHEDGTVAMYSFAMPQEKNLPNEPRLNKESLPQWVNERVAVLQICQQGDIIEGVGQKVSDRVYYVIE